MYGNSYISTVIFDLCITKGTLYFPHEWLSRNSENKFPHERRSREWGNFFLLWLLSHEWGKYYVPWVMNGEIYPSLFLLSMGFSFPFGERKLQKCEKMLNCDKKIREIHHQGCHWSMAPLVPPGVPLNNGTLGDITRGAIDQWHPWWC